MIDVHPGEGEPGEGEPGEGELGEPGDGPHRTLLVFVLAGLIIIFIVAVVIFLLYLRDRGNTIAGPLSFGGTAIALVVTVVFWLVRPEDLHAPFWLAPALRMVAFLVGVGAIVGSVVLLVIALQDRQYPVTNAVRLSGAESMHDGAEAIASLPNPEGRKGLAIVPVLQSLDPRTGNCVGGTRIESTLLVDGVRKLPPQVTSSGREIRFSLESVQQEASVAFKLEVLRDPMCVLRVEVSQAYLYTE